MDSNETNKSGMRYKPSLELLQSVVDAFMPQQKITESFDIYLNRINEEKVVERITSIFPEIELIYFPSKLNSILCTKNKKHRQSRRTVRFTLETCVLILRQFLRSHEYIVKTKSLKRKDTVNRIMTIIPPSHMIPTENIILTNPDEDVSDSETESDTGSE